MLTTEKLKLVQDLVSGASKEEMIWLNGYIAGLIAQEPIPNRASAVTLPTRVTIAYGTETGNSKKLAVDFAARAKKTGINPKLVSLEQYRLDDLPKEEYFFTVISTQGEGEPPMAAKKFYDHIHKNGFKLPHLKYSVLALGDTAYPLFCKAGEDVDDQLQRLGGERIAPLIKCDTDYHDDAGKWFGEVLQNFEQRKAEISPTPAAQPESKKTGKRVFLGKVLANINLNDRGSNKQTHHIELSAEGLDYKPGDSIGIIPENPKDTVEAIIQLSGINASEKVVYRNQETEIDDLLLNRLSIIFLPDRVVRKYASIVGQEIPHTRMGLLELLKIYPVRDVVQFREVLSVLDPITPRLYSISSSPAAHENEVHITVALDRFSVNNEHKCGLCSDFLSRLPIHSELQFYIHRNAQFRLPDAGKDIIMIGPGTGIAPFRAFLAERDARGATGRNWLFFGDQHFRTDFLYQTEIQNWIQTDVLTRVNVAFSRDSSEKVYVQHKMVKHGQELFSWIEAGAHIYVCGARDPMSMDVERTLISIIQSFGNRSEQEAADYLEQLSLNERYVKDVY